ncbi:MAG: hypothetical protein KDK37_09130 [Leptospiraceae bacterium]|nr:hypothetical protein [Leptospiraceae bacterium]MCB1304429.1 hypothetical protein [Leptospiraceae bacterium]
MSQWLGAGAVVQALGLVFYQLVLWVLPQPEESLTDLQLQPTMSFVEFQEPTKEDVSSSRDLSDEIVETQKKSDKEPINWTNAANPATDFSSRYVGRIAVNVSSNDYPADAARAGAGSVTVAVSLLILPSGQIQDVRIRNVRFQNPVGEDFKNEFIIKARQILLTRARLATPPYKKNGVATKFILNTTITFELP